MKLLIFSILLALTSAFAENKKIKLGLNWKAEPEFGGFYAAKVLGIYEKAGFDVEITEGSAGIPIAQMVASGKIDFGITSGDHIILSRSNGADLKAIFTVYQKSPQCVMVREESPIKSIKDLMNSDYTLSATPGSTWLTWFKKKYPPKNLKMVPYQGGISSFLNDKKFSQQCFVGSEPELANAKGVKTRTLLLADDGYDNYAAILFASNAYIKKDKALVTRFVEATRQGWEAYIKDPSAAHKAISELNPAMTPETIDVVFAAQKPLMVASAGRKLGQMDNSRWETLVKQMMDVDLIKKPVKAKDLFQQF